MLNGFFTRRHIIGKDSKEVRVNERIRASKVRVISPDGEQLGIMTVDKAMELAKEQHLDLVEVASGAEPTVCRIMDYGKYKYDQEKKAKKAKKKNKTMDVKEVQFSPMTEEHDYQFKKNHLIRFLQNKDKAKATIKFKGRQITHTALGRKVLDRLREDLLDFGLVESEPVMEGKKMFMVFSPKSNTGESKNAKAENA